MQTQTTGKVRGIIANLVTIEVDGPVAQNEICFIHLGDTRLMAEVIKVAGNNASAQVYESTRGLRVGDNVTFEGHMLEVNLGPGLLSSNYDGLQNNLATMEGVFLKRGEYTEPIDREKKWDFEPLAKKGDTVTAGDWLGQVMEGWMVHRIMVPFVMTGTYTLTDIASQGSYTVDHRIATLKDGDGRNHEVTMVQKWPVKRAITAYKEKPRPDRVMETGVRTIDTFNPIAEGGTGFIPGPFGSGKTVLQHALAKQAETDIIVMAACGERANEVVEIFTEFPRLIDARTGRHLMERTTIICNTSNMPVAAREASVYTAITICEYYRAMGHRALLLADSTSRWAQALREMSNRMEELPGQDAFPMDLPAIISNFYSRAGIVKLNNGQTGSVTIIGTVSPAGGNLKEPVTESTQKATRCFYALSQNRADRKRYPAIDPMDSYSKYLEYPEIMSYYAEKVGPDWIGKILEGKNYVRRGKEAYEQINILGDDGVPLDYHVSYWKSELIDFIILQQDAFDDIDASTPMDRQVYMYSKVIDVCRMQVAFEDFEECSAFYKKLINLFRQMNYQEFHSDEFKRYETEIEEHLTQKVQA